MMERLRVRVYYDFASTLCYVGYRVMQRMRSDLDALAIVLDWTPLDLDLEDDTDINGLPDALLSL